MRPIITLSDGIEVLDTTGDLDAFEYGGGVVYRTPQKETYWQFWEPRERGRKNFYVFTAPIPDKVLDFYDFVEPEILCTVGQIDKRELARISRSKDHKQRAFLVGIIKDAYGPSSIDPNETSEVLTPWELASRWGDVYGVSTDETPQANLEDYIVREHKQVGEAYECGRIEGAYFGRFETYEDALCAVAHAMAKGDGFSCNVFHEHEPGKLELIDWDPQEYLERPLKKHRRAFSNAFWKNAMRHYINDDKIKSRIRARQKSHKDVLRARQRSKAKLNQQKRIERARDFRRSMEDIYR